MLLKRVTACLGVGSCLPRSTCSPLACVLPTFAPFHLFRLLLFCQVLIMVGRAGFTNRRTKNKMVRQYYHSALARSSLMHAIITNECNHYY